MAEAYDFIHPLSRNPNGWFAVALSDDLKQSTVRPISCMGRNLVVFRTEFGRVSVQDAYCPHLGAHLGYGGCVKGDRLYCPFHQWALDAGGRCLEIPYADKIPPKAVNRALPVFERNGVILAWFHDESKPPHWEIPEFSKDHWSPPRWVELTYKVHIQDVAENGVDLAHFPVLHHCSRSGIDLIQVDDIPFRFVLKTAYPGDGIGVPGEDVNVTTRWAYYGLGMFEGISLADDFGTEVRQLYHFTPVSDEKVLFRAAISVNTETIAPDAIDMVLDKNAEIMKKNLDQDAPIWANKQYWQSPALCLGDGPFGILRRWTKQFYPGVSDVSSNPRGQRETALLEDSDSPPEKSWLHHEAMLAKQQNEPQKSESTKRRDVSTQAVRAIFFEKIPALFNDRATGGKSFTVQYQITGENGGSYFVQVAGNHCRPFEGQSDNPSVTVTIDSQDWIELQAGNLNPARAFMTGKLKVGGDRNLAMKLGQIFPIKRSGD